MYKRKTKTLAQILIENGILGSPKIQAMQLERLAKKITYKKLAEKLGVSYKQLCCFIKKHYAEYMKQYNSYSSVVVAVKNKGLGDDAKAVITDLIAKHNYTEITKILGVGKKALSNYIERVLR